MRRRNMMAGGNAPPVIDRVFENNDWKTIAYVSRLPEFADMTDSGIEETYGWKVGDSKAVELSGGRIDQCNFAGGTYKAMIIGFNHNKEYEGSGIQLCIAGNSPPFIMKMVRMNTSNTNSGGWKNCAMRNTFLVALKELFPSDLKKQIRKTVKYTDNTGGTGTSYEEKISSSEDELFLMSEYEYFGVITKGNSYEADFQKKYQYMIEHSVLGNDNRWLRSPVKDTGSNFCNVSWYNEGHGYLEATRNDLYIIPCFRV